MSIVEEYMFHSFVCIEPINWCLLWLSEGRSVRIRCIVSSVFSTVFTCLGRLPWHIMFMCELTMAYLYLVVHLLQYRFSDTVLGNMYISFVERKMKCSTNPHGHGPYSGHLHRTSKIANEKIYICIYIIYSIRDHDHLRTNGGKALTSAEFR